MCHPDSRQKRWHQEQTSATFDFEGSVHPFPKLLSTVGQTVSWNIYSERISYVRALVSGTEANRCANPNMHFLEWIPSGVDILKGDQILINFWQAIDFQHT